MVSSLSSLSDDENADTSLSHLSRLYSGRRQSVPRSNRSNFTLGRDHRPLHRLSLQVGASPLPFVVVGQRKQSSGRGSPGGSFAVVRPTLELRGGGKQQLKHRTVHLLPLSPSLAMPSTLSPQRLQTSILPSLIDLSTPRSLLPTTQTLLLLSQRPLSRPPLEGRGRVVFVVETGDVLHVRPQGGAYIRSAAEEEGVEESSMAKLGDGE